VLAVVLGTVGGEVLGVIGYISSGELMGFTYADAFPLVMYILTTDPAAMSVLVRNVISGVMFALLGVWIILRNVKKEVSGVKVTELK